MADARRRLISFGVAALLAGLAGRVGIWWALGPVAVDAGPPRPPGGAILAHGGGGVSDDVRARFLDLAGGRQARLVVIPTAADDADDPAAAARFVEPWRRAGAVSVRLLHTRDRATADTPAFVRPLAEATGAWIGGGLQARLADTYAGTEVERQLQALVRRGGVVGGTSAGASILTRVMVVSGRDEPVEGRGFDLLPGAVVDISSVATAWAGSIGCWTRTRIASGSDSTRGPRWWWRAVGSRSWAAPTLRRACRAGSRSSSRATAPISTRSTQAGRASSPRPISTRCSPRPIDRADRLGSQNDDPGNFSGQMRWPAVRSAGYAEPPLPRIALEPPAARNASRA